MPLNQYKNKNLKNYFNFLIALFPLSFIAGNLSINFNIVLLILSTFIVFNKEIFDLKFQLIDKIIFSYFLFILFTGIYNDINFYVNDLYPKGINTILKSILFFRYFLLYLVIRFLIEREVINLKLFFIFSAISTVFVSLDIFYQFLFGKDIFGYQPIESSRKLSGPFGDELIAGSFIQRFSIFTLFLVPLFFQNKIKYFKLFNLLIFFILLLGMILSGNRMPFVMFILSILLIFIFEKNMRKNILFFLIIFCLTFGIILKFNNQVFNNFYNFYGQISKLIIISTNNQISKTQAPPYYKEFQTFHDTWLMNKYIGGGIKNFRWYCHHRQPGIHKSKGFICNMHPHNYYFEILTETGLIGFFIILSFLLLTVYKIFHNNFNLKHGFYNNKFIVPFAILFIVEIFPIKSTGSFYTTNNATYFFLILGLIISWLNKKKLIENKL